MRPAISLSLFNKKKNYWNRTNLRGLRIFPVRLVFEQKTSRAHPP